MRPFRFLILAAALLGPSAQADWLLSGYSTLACDSAAVRQLYGASTYSNLSSRTNLTVPVAGSLKVDATFASEGTEGYSANLGLMHPYRSDWSTVNLTGLTAVTFDIKTSAKPTDGWEFSFGSKAYGDLAAAGTVFLTAFAVPAAGAWTTVTITPDMFAYPSWFCDDILKPCPKITLQQVLAATEYIQIAPKTKYSNAGSMSGVSCASCVAPTTQPISFEIRNITLAGWDYHPRVNPVNQACWDATHKFVLDDFTDGDDQDRLGGYWYAYSDTNSARVDDTTVGTSTIDRDIVDERAVATAALNKNMPLSSFLYHKYAGWAALATSVDAGLPGSLSGVQAIGFKLQTDSAFSDKIGVSFQIKAKGVRDDRVHQVLIPKGLMDGRGEICVRIGGGNLDVRQPSWVAVKDSLDLTKIEKLGWELRILDQSDSNISVAAGTIRLDDVVLYGDATMKFPDVIPHVPSQDPPTQDPLPPGPASCTDGIRPRDASARAAAFAATYDRGVLSIQGLDGAQSLEIVGLDGRKVAAFSLDGVSLRQGLAVDLQAGAYLLLVRDAAGRTLTRTLPVVH